ncbi:1-phosphatidylinositol 3-phosphate 5-kinase [Rhynchospora pubera]|uniref:1-phosphatidylinositol-3-phosphate 5-kinase n=1 Tax=Rhynchospora pubera TaxID=906938 RepID=A0AAV8FND4_9POAL|nr:1-phosphatidylinositol 3-phosphate 5-kinase [Rhynchospora pubera]
MGVEENLVDKVPQKVQCWINCLPENLSRSLMEGADDDCSRCHSCGGLECETCVPARCGSADCCALGSNGFGKETGEENSSLLSLERMDESTGPVQLGSDGAKIEQLVNELHFSQRTLRYSYSSPRSMDCDDDEFSSSFFTPSSSFSGANTSDSESTTLTELPSFKSSIISSPRNSPRRSPELGGDATPTSRPRNGPFDPYSPNYARQRSYPGSMQDLSNSQIILNDDENGRPTPPPINLEGNSLIWYPPPPADEGDDAENGFYELDEDEDSNSGLLADSGSDEDGFGLGEEGNSNLTQKEVLRGALHGHFRALVAQLLEGQGVGIEKESFRDDWLEIVAYLAWQAANFVKPDTQRGGSMDPASYVKVKCVASGTPSDSTFVKGVVCSKNVKHKRMVSQHRNPRLFLLGGALEYQKTPNKLASLDTVLEQEKEHLKRIVAAIEARRPNVLLVEKSASLYAQEILSKDISLVLNVKRKLLERIASCTGSRIASSTEALSSARLGHCRTFRTEKVTTESLAEGTMVGKKAAKTLMFFDGCPKRLGCTILLRGGSLEELKKVKHAAQFAVFAAYHLSLETSFLADEGASLPKLLAPFESTGDKYLTNGDFSIQNPDEKEFDSSPRSQTDQDESREESTLEEKSDNEQKRVYLSEDHREMTTDIFSTDENQQSILVSLSSTYAVKGSGTVCEQSQLFRIKFYGGLDKPLGRYLREDLFGQAPYCSSCNEPTENHVKCYTHQQGTLTISVKRLSSDVKLPGERDGKIWMWHRCLRCPSVEEIPPATPRVVMSNAAWGLSFGKFLELSFSNHTTANRVAGCGHSLQRDCLRFYGFGSMVAVFRYSPVDILSVKVPPSVMDFTNRVPLEWVRDQMAEICSRADCLYIEISHVLNNIQRNLPDSQNEAWKESILKEISDLREVVRSEKVKYDVSLRLVTSESVNLYQPLLDVLELNRLSRGLLDDAYRWDRCLSAINHLAKQNSDANQSETSSRRQEENISPHVLECKTNNIVDMDLSIEYPEGYVGPAGLSLISGQCIRQEESLAVGSSSDTSAERTASSTSSLSERIDMAWTGSTDQTPASSFGGSFKLMDNPVLRRAMAPARVHSDLSLTTINMSKDQFTSIRRAYSQKTPKADDTSNMALLQPTMHMLPASCTVMHEGARVAMLTHANTTDVVITIHDDELTSIIASAMTSQEYYTFISPMSDHDSTGSLTEETHFRVSFDDDASSPADKGRYSVTCYFAKQFDVLRKTCCPSEMDFIRSISRSKKWSAYGGKSNAYFAKTLDERFIVKQVTRTELDSFEDFAAEYFKYMTESLKTGSPTCLAKVVGLYQVVAKNLKNGREMRMDFMVMENLFFGRNVSRIYDLKGSLRSRYNHDTSGNNKVLLDLNLLENLHTKPIFLGFKAKRRLERSVWNDTSFLASMDVMDYSLLVGIDEEKKELVIGIIDYLRQYTWDKKMETWVKASGLLGGPKNTLPTVISPSQYKKRFRKAMSKYFLTLPDQWSS